MAERADSAVLRVFKSLETKPKQTYEEIAENTKLSWDKTVDSVSILRKDGEVKSEYRSCTDKNGCGRFEHSLK